MAETEKILANHVQIFNRPDVRRFFVEIVYRIVVEALTLTNFCERIFAVLLNLNVDTELFFFSATFLLENILNFVLFSIFSAALCKFGRTDFHFNLCSLKKRSTSLLNEIFSVGFYR